MSDPQTESATPIDTDYACFAKAKEKGEPTFSLRAQDYSAPAVIEYWANLNQDHLGPAHPKIVQARQIAETMRAWPARRPAD